MAFGFYTAYTVDHTKVPNTDQTNFPVGIIDNSGLARLKTTGNGGHVTNSSGFDIRPFSDSGLTTALTYELVFYDAATGKLEMWVKIPTLSHTTDTIIYLGYGNSSLTTDGSSTSTWDSLFKAVWHFPNGTTLTANDSTSNVVNSTSINAAVTATAGQMDGGAVQTNTSGAEILAGSGSNFPKNFGVTDFTFSAWFQSTLLLSHDNLLFQASQGSQGFGMNINASGQLDPYDRGVADHNIGSAGDVVINKRYFLAFTHVASSAATVAYLYNATDVTLKTYSQTIGYIDNTSTATGSIIIGNNDLLGRNWTGMYDEMRVSSGGASSGAARSADWVATDYNNQSSPSTFYAVGAEQTVGGAAAIANRIYEKNQAITRASTY